MRRVITAALGLALFACLQGRLAIAQDSWPQRSVRLIVPTGAGGSTDQLARMPAGRLTTKLGQPVIAQNRAVAGRVRELAPNARIEILPHDCYHPSGSHPDECARLTGDFIQSIDRAGA